MKTTQPPSKAAVLAAERIAEDLYSLSRWNKSTQVLCLAEIIDSAIQPLREAAEMVVKYDKDMRATGYSEPLPKYLLDALRTALEQEKR